MATMLGIISDTHGLVREEALRALAGAALILHAGDVGAPEVLAALRRIAPVRAVRGNIDREGWAGRLPHDRVVRVEGARIYMIHDLAELNFDPAARGFQAVVSGHSHRPRREMCAGVLYLNPGSAGPRRFRLPVTVARVVVEGARLQAEVIAI